MMSINIRKKHVAWISVIIISLALLGIAVGQYASGGSFPLIGGHPLHVTDIHDDQKLADISHNVWFGQVDAKTSQVEDKDDEPYTLYSVTVLGVPEGHAPRAGGGRAVRGGLLGRRSLPRRGRPGPIGIWAVVSLRNPHQRCGR